MKDIFKNFEESKQKVEKEIVPTMREIVLELKELVESKSIVSFEFLKNSDYLASEKPIYIRVGRVGGEKINDVRLGLFNDFKEILKSQKISINQDLFKKLENINATLYFLNENFSKVMPFVEHTYYSTNAVNQLGGFLDNPVKNLLPSFLMESEKINKPKI